MKRKISFPAMGWSKIAFKALFYHLPGIEIFEPPKVTRDVVEFGAKHSPEFVCHPFKVTLGEFLNMAEKYGVNTFVQAVDCGPCRFGFYAPVQERIMKDLGYNVEIIPIQQGDLLTLEWLNTYYRLSPIKGRIMRLFDIIPSVRLYFIKLKYIEEIMKLEGFLRCREINKGDTTIIVANLMKKLDEENDMMKLHNFDQVIKTEFSKMPIDRDMKPLRVTIGGEMHILQEQFVNMEIVKRFGEEGCEVHMGHSLYDWVMHKLHLSFRRKDIERYAKKYIPMDIGGEAMWIMGDYIKTQGEGFDGFVHVYPFTCMPETTARNMIEAQAPDPFYMPIQFYSFDEHSGFEGMRTRIEAFIDLMATNRRGNPKFMGKYEEPKEIAEIYDNPIKPVGITEFIKAMVNPLAELVTMGLKMGKSDN